MVCEVYLVLAVQPIVLEFIAVPVDVCPPPHSLLKIERI